MTMPRVFIPQIVEKYDHDRGIRVPVFDLTSAAAFGSLIPILDAQDNPMFLSVITEKIVAALEGFTEGDYFVAVGDPSVIALCAGIILRKQKSLKMLKWDKKLTQYLTLELKP